MPAKPVAPARAQLGQRVRQLRRRDAKTLRDVSLLTGLSKSTLSKIESGSLSVSYDNLVKIAGALSLDMGTLMSVAPVDGVSADRARRSVTRSNGGALYETNQYQYELLCDDLSKKQMLPMVATLRAHDISPTSDLISHPGEEFIYVLQGTVVVHTDTYAPLTLAPGDSLYFDSTMGHSLLSSGTEDARILWVATGGVPQTLHGLRPGATESPPSRKRTRRRG